METDQMNHEVTLREGHKFRVRRAGREQFIHVVGFETVAGREMVKFVPVRGTKTRMAPVESFEVLEEME